MHLTGASVLTLISYWLQLLPLQSHKAFVTTAPRRKQSTLALQIICFLNGCLKHALSPFLRYTHAHPTPTHPHTFTVPPVGLQLNPTGGTPWCVSLSQRKIQKYIVCAAGMGPHSSRSVYLNHVRSIRNLHAFRQRTHCSPFRNTIFFSTTEDQSSANDAWNKIVTHGPLKPNKTSH